MSAMNHLGLIIVCLSRFNQLQFAVIPFKHLFNVPTDKLHFRIIGLSLREADLFTVKPHKPFLKAH